MKKQPMDIVKRLRATRATMLGTEDEQHYVDCHEAADEIKRLGAALENCRLLAARHRTEEWAKHILRFCEEAGIKGSPLRTEL